MTDRTYAERSLLRQLLGFEGVPARIVAVTALVSGAALLLALLQGWPLWGIVLAALLPWVPLCALDLTWTYRHYGPLALFYLLTVTQGGHFLEHLIQVTQIHVLGTPVPQAQGVFSQLDVEWVHFGWNSWVLIAVVLLLRYFRSNPWLWATLVLAGWHEIEHVYMMVIYLSTGKAGDPGLLATGGLIGGGLPLIRPDLHFLYNLIETTPLVLAFIYTLRRTHNQWLAQAFPNVPTPILVAATKRLQRRHVAAGQTVPVATGSRDLVYIVTRGEATFSRQDSTGNTAVQTLGPGQVVSRDEAVEVRARTNLELLTLDPTAVRALMDHAKPATLAGVA